MLRYGYLFVFHPDLNNDIHAIALQRIFDDVFTEDGIPLSDHYGIEVFFKRSVYDQLSLSNHNLKDDREVCSVDDPDY